VTSSFHRDVDEIYALLGYYTASSGNPLPTFQDNLSVPSSRVFLDFLTLEAGTDTSVKDYHSTLRNIPEERRSNPSAVNFRIKSVLEEQLQQDLPVYTALHLRRPESSTSNVIRSVINTGDRQI
jgi:hypothetical protein